MLDGASGERLDLSAYLADFQERFDAALQFWKLERGQVFEEPRSESWKAFRRGDWEESLRLMDGLRPGFTDYRRRNDARGMSSRRVRVAELPLTPFMQWELRYLLLRDEHAGHLTRIVQARDVAALEAGGTLPEIGVLDGAVVYDVIYEPEGPADHAIRYDDAALAGRCRDLIAGLYEQGEPISDFYRREIEPLPAPQGR